VGAHSDPDPVEVFDRGEDPDGASLVFSQVPEPRTALLYSTALLAVVALRRLR
jgi:hypothetical protein